MDPLKLKNLHARPGSKLSYEIEEAISRLLATQPFFAVLLMDLLKIREVEPQSFVKTMATDQKHLWINPEYWKTLKHVDERVFGIAHEVTHTISEHCSRGKLYAERGLGPDLKPFNHKKWNYAIDYVTNAMLVEGRVGKMMQGVLYDPNIATSNSLEDDVYRALPDDFDKDRGRGRDQGPLDEHIDPTDGEGPTKEEIQRAVENAANAVKTMGTMPAWMERFCKKICEPQVDWREQIRHALYVTTGRDDLSFTRPNKRKLALAPHIYMPGRASYQAGVIASFDDTSGSVSGVETAHFRGEMAAIFDEIKPIEHWYGSCAMECSDPLLADSSDDIRNYTSTVGGGTHMPAIFAKLDEKGIMPEVLVVLTDGETDFGEQPPYEVIWVITRKDITAPFGRTVHIEAIGE
jgi:predicted metal-dependent peptidase